MIKHIGSFISFSFFLKLSIVFFLSTSLALSDKSNLIKIHAFYKSQLSDFNFSDVEYLGAFRLSSSTFGDSSLNYAQGPIAFNKQSHSLFIVGHTHQQAIAEFPIPKPSLDTDFNKIPIVNLPLQPFSKVLTRLESNPDMLNRITGLEYFLGKLFVNAIEYYDADGNSTHTSFVIEKANDLSDSKVSGTYQIEGASHANGWISSIPESWQRKLRGKWITGHSSGIPIISRASVGPSAFVLNLFDFGLLNPVPTTRLLDFPLDHALNDDLENKSGSNLVWTHFSKAVYGLIIPGTSTYLTIGHSGGHNSGICYKCKPVGAKDKCAGHCAADTSDYNLMYWLWDANDFIKVLNDELYPEKIRPYEYGAFSLPFESKTMGGATFDAETNELFISLLGEDKSQGLYSNSPIIVVLKIP